MLSSFKLQSLYALVCTQTETRFFFHSLIKYAWKWRGTVPEISETASSPGSDANRYVITRKLLYSQHKLSTQRS
jgi:hypothetical protein